MTLVCLHCQSENRERSRFCRRCGQRLSERAPVSRRARPRSAPAQPAGPSAVDPRELAPALWLAGLLVANHALHVLALRFVPDTITLFVASLGLDAVLVALFARSQRRELAPLLRPPRTLAWLPAAALASLVASLVALGGDRLARALALSGEAYETRLIAAGWPAAGALALVVVGPALWSEIALGGVVQTRFAKLVGARDAVLARAMVGGAWALYADAFVAAAAVGVVLGTLRQRCDSLLPSLVASVAAALAVQALS